YIFRMTSSTLNKFTLTCDRLSHFESKFCNPTEPRPSQYTCKVHLDQVRALRDKVEKEYEACSELISVGFEGPADTLPTLQAKYNYSYFIYERCSAQLMEQNETISAKAAPVQSIPPKNSVPSGCRLPPCDTEVFSGDYLRWPTFRDVFTAVYIENPALTPVEKLFFLNAKTSGEANSIVSNSPLTNDGFRSAWRNLTERFENKRSLVNSHLKKLLNMQSYGMFPPIASCVLPHHAVFKKGPQSTKQQIVFNVFSRTSNGRSLNDILWTGPTLQNDSHTPLAE
ncbi:hypothetical protein KR054_000775, partial [Drosophila jambulina]